MDTTLNKDILVAKWEENKVKVRERWGRLSNEQLDQINGYYDELTRLLRERYGYTKDKVRQEVDEFLGRLDFLEPQP
ncbi:MAG TPA: hypothetical protein VFO91_00505 [Anaerolineales bacterium]|nr:hypothetical protein [Anaerolineales bacterium]